MKYSKNAIEIYKRLYFDELQNETMPEEVHTRVANYIGTTDEEKEEFKKILDDGSFRPNSPCLINAGRKAYKDHDQQLAACFVLGLEDSMESIIDMWSICAKIYASGAGAGIPITNLREQGSPISSGGAASGPLNYLRVVDIVSDTVRSGGRTRRAANIGVFKYNHPEAINIINSKNNGNRLTNFNLSMDVSNEFMEKIHEENFTFPIISPNKNKFIKEMNIKDLWNLIIENAWKTGDPGLFFTDQVNKFNPFPSIPIECPNPCGEVPLPPWSVCNIGSINLNNFIKETPGFATDDTFTPYFEWDKFQKVVYSCVKFLDNVIDKTSYLHPKFEKSAKTYRPIGLGIMGFADILIKMGIPYGSKESITLFEEICYKLNYNAILASIKLCTPINENQKPKQKPRKPIYISEKDYDHFKSLIDYYTKDAIIGNKHVINLFEKYGIRNSNWTCIAPTGSISMSVDASYAWEPLMALIWEKPLVDSNEILTIMNPQFENDLDNLIKKQIFPENKKQILEKIIKNKGSIQNLNFPAEIKNIYKVAHDIDPKKKIDMQAAGQKWISLAISSTCNLPNSATKKDVEEIYYYAYKSGLKGITIFRDGCLENQVVNFGEIKKETKKTIERPVKRKGETVEINTPHGKLFVTCNYENSAIKHPFEIFFRVGKQGALTNVLIDALGRVCSKAMQFGLSIESIAETLRGLSGEKFWFKIDDEIDKNQSAESIVDAISQIIDYHWNQNLQSKNNSDTCEEQNTCPQCHRKTLRHDTGCRGGVCTACSYSTCE